MSELWVMGCGLRVVGYGLWVVGYGLWVMGYGLWVMGYGLWVMGYGLWVVGYKLGMVGLSEPRICADLAVDADFWGFAGLLSESQICREHLADGTHFSNGQSLAPTA